MAAVERRTIVLVNIMAVLAYQVRIIGKNKGPASVIAQWLNCRCDRLDRHIHNNRQSHPLTLTQIARISPREFFFFEKSAPNQLLGEPKWGARRRKKRRKQKQLLGLPSDLKPDVTLNITPSFEKVLEFEKFDWWSPRCDWPLKALQIRGCATLGVRHLDATHCLTEN